MNREIIFPLKIPFCLSSSIFKRLQETKAISEPEKNAEANNERKIMERTAKSMKYSSKTNLRY